jgi:hypothetical protein
VKLFAFHHEDQNYAVFDPWSLIHLTSGMFAGLVGVGPVLSMSAAIGYDVFEQLAEREPWGQQIFRTPGSENWENILADLGLFALGWYLGHRYHETPPRALNPAPNRPLIELEGY